MAVTNKFDNDGRGIDKNMLAMKLDDSPRYFVLYADTLLSIAGKRLRIRNQVFKSAFRLFPKLKYREKTISGKSK